MTHKHHSEKHSKKRHFVGKDQMNSKEKMAAFQPAEKSVVDEKTEPANPMVDKQTVEPAKQTLEVKPTPITDISPIPPVMAQRAVQFARKKNALEKLKDKFHQLINHFK